MIVAFSTSSPQASVALIEDGRVLASGEEIAGHAASGGCLRILQRLLDSTGLRLDEATVFAADLGPGSFTGVRVGVTLAKSLAYALGVEAGGADAFDLVARDQVVAVPSRRDERWVRAPGRPPYRTRDAVSGAVGYGMDGITYPHAAKFAELVLQALPPALLVPRYLIEPSISRPKRPYGLEGHVP